MTLTRTKTKRANPVVQPVVQEEAEAWEQSLRPRTLQDYIGQRKVREHLSLHVEAARKRNESLGHTLLHGPPGLGKTTLANIIGHEMGAQVRCTSGPAIEKPGDLASLLTNLSAGDVLFIDEIHRLRPVVEEVLYGAMEDFLLDIVIGKGPTARSVRLNLQPFTLVGATTKAGAVSAPLRDRFLHQFKLAFYDEEEMCQIVRRSGALLSLDMDDTAARMIAAASRATPRIGNRLVRAVRDVAQVRDLPAADRACVQALLDSLDIDADGLDATDRQLLSAIVETFAGGPVGLSTLAAVLAEEPETLEDVYEPYLMQQGLLQRTPKGRIATRKAYEKMGVPVPKDTQQTLL